MRTTSILALALCISACEIENLNYQELDAEPQQNDAQPNIEQDAAVEITPDANALPDATFVAPDAEPQPSDAALDESPDAESQPELCENEPSPCAGSENFCGGCGPLPCSVYAMNLIRDEENNVNVDQSLYHLSTILQHDTYSDDALNCEIAKFTTTSADLGIVTLNTPIGRIDFDPSWESGNLRYHTNPALGSLSIYDAQSTIQVLAQSNNERFSVCDVAPENLSYVNGLDELLEHFHGNAQDSTLRLEWSYGADQSVPLHLYAGGSAVIFSQPNYTSMRYYTLNLELEDLGALELSTDFIEPVPSSAVWAYLERNRETSRILNENLFTLTLGQRREARLAGQTSSINPLLELLEPNPTSRTWTGRIAWTPINLPIQISMSAHKGSETTQITCSALNPDVHSVDWPIKLDEFLPANPDLRIITLHATERAVDLQGEQYQGNYQLKASVQLTL